MLILFHRSSVMSLIAVNKIWSFASRSCVISNLDRKSTVDFNAYAGFRFLSLTNDLIDKNSSHARKHLNRFSTIRANVSFLILRLEYVLCFVYLSLLLTDWADDSINRFLLLFVFRLIVCPILTVSPWICVTKDRTFSVESVKCFQPL